MTYPAVASIISTAPTAPCPPPRGGTDLHAQRPSVDRTPRIPKVLLVNALRQSLRHRRPPVAPHGIVLLAAAILTTLCAVTRAQPSEGPGVTIQGTNTNGIVFVWEVTNNTQNAINFFDVPVYDINTFEHPEGWVVTSSPRLKKKGNFTLETDHYPSMILPGRTLEFLCKRPLRDTAKDGRASVTVGFEDGTRIVIPNVLAPVQAMPVERFALPVFLGSLLVFAFLYKVRKDKKPASPTGPVADHGSTRSSGAGE